jgi:putative transposase
MVKNRHLSKSINDAAWGRFLTWVKYYAGVHDVPAIAVPPHFTSQRYSRCGTLVKKSLSVRTHVCPTCGLILDRDHNAASNILQEAHQLGEQRDRTGGQSETGGQPQNASGQTASTRSRRKARAGKRAG